MRAGWMRPSCRSFSSVMRATSRRTPSNALSTTALGVSSMMKSTPVRFSSARMLRPSRPMIRPFMSSLGSCTTLTVVSAACDAASRCMATDEDRPHAPLGVALGLLLDLAQDAAGVVARVLLDVLEQRLLGLAGADPGEALQRLLALEAQPFDLVGVRADVLVAALQLGLAAVEVGAATVQRGLQRLGAHGAVLQLGGPAQKLCVLGGGDRRDRGGSGDGGERRDRPPTSVNEGRDDDGCSDERRADQGFHVGVLSPAVDGSGGWSPMLRLGARGAATGRWWTTVSGPAWSERTL